MGGFAGHEVVAAAIAGNPNVVWEQLVIDTQSHCGVGDGRFRLDLPPLTILAQTPFVAHDVSPVDWLSGAAKTTSSRVAQLVLRPA